ATWLVSSPDDKPPVWRALARHGQLVVIDDLAGSHEGPAPVPYERLVEEAQRIPAGYVGLAVIERVRITGAPDLPREIVAGLSRSRRRRRDRTIRKATLPTAARAYSVSL